MNRRSLSDQSLTASHDKIKDNTMKSPCVIQSRNSDRLKIVCLIFSMGNIINGLWMLIEPSHWYYNLPGVPESGPLNVHFVRDVGCIFFISGVGLLIAAFSIEYRLPLFTINTSFYMMHMFVYIHEVISGRLRPGIFWTDLPDKHLTKEYEAFKKLRCVKFKTVEQGAVTTVWMALTPEGVTIVEIVKLKQLLWGMKKIMVGTPDVWIQKLHVVYGKMVGSIDDLQGQ
ncbi:unnamed protein product [Didymodactylos carnosus]|uniref:Uncharacterized protein n=1 Tax=Didymodactylos carnosus TaxID=1234261 RepID=A0A8S2JZE4_9BILA|nr:unnamed protein product [Didymodactylos carnosus]CAF3830548.1 unnamed protein product [Didymodactylos carnosus]